MRHIDPREVALIALGMVSPSSGDTRHFGRCLRCSNVRRQYARVVAVARAVAQTEQLAAPGPQVWLAIRAQLGLAAAMPGDRLTEVVAAHRPENSTAPRGRRTGRKARAIAAALITTILLVAIVVGAIVWPSVTPTRARVLASATLDGMPAWPDAAGTAVAQERPDGSRELQVTVREPATRGTTREVWLHASDGSDMVSLGFLDGASGLFAVPDGLDLAEWSLVDVSDEPPDGNPAHSGNSIVRGPLV
jgi:hypothetical protein